MSEMLGQSGFGAANITGEEDTEATVIIDERGLVLKDDATILLEDEQGGLADIRASLTHKDFALYGVANADFGDGPPDPSLNITVGLGPYTRAVRNTAGLVGYWRLNESSGTAAREEVNGYTSTYTGGFTLGADGALVTPEHGGGRDKAVTLNGSTGYVAVTTAAALHPGDTFSLECWFKRGSVSTSTNNIFSLGPQDFEVDIDNHFIRLAKQATSVVYITDGTVADTRWHHLVVTKDGADRHIYLDGVEMSGTGTNATIVASSQPPNIGRRTVAGDRHFDGTLDEVALYNTALSAETAAAHYELGSDPYYSPDLAPSNFMPYWRFVQSSNMNITAKQVTDAASPVGSNFRFTMATGQATDEAFIEQIVPIGGSRYNWARLFPRVVANVVSASGAGADLILQGQFLREDYTLTGSVFLSTIAVSAGLKATGAWGSPNAAPTDANYCRLRIILDRDTAATSVTAEVDLTEVRAERGQTIVALPDTVNSNNSNTGIILNQSGTLKLDSAEGIELEVAQGFWVRANDSTGGRLTTLGPFAGCLLVPTTEATATATPEIIDWDSSEDYDTDGYHSLVTNPSRITIPTDLDGFYVFFCLGVFAANATGDRSLSLFQNGASVWPAFRQRATASGQWRGNMTTQPIYALAGDYFQVQVEQDSGGNLNFTNTSRFGCYRVG